VIEGLEDKLDAVGEDQGTCCMPRTRVMLHQLDQTGEDDLAGLSACVYATTRGKAADGFAAACGERNRQPPMSQFDVFEHRGDAFLLVRTKRRCTTDSSSFVTDLEMEMETWGIWAKSRYGHEG